MNLMLSKSCSEYDKVLYTEIDIAIRMTKLLSDEEGEIEWITSKAASRRIF
jgi:hypothetical protein